MCYDAFGSYEIKLSVFPAKEIVTAKYSLTFANKSITLPLILSVVINLCEEFFCHINPQAILGQSKITQLNRCFRKEFCCEFLNRCKVSL